MKLFSSKRRIVAAAALVVLALFLLRPGASRLKSRIISSLSAGVGRPVDVSSVHIRLLPRPGFDLDNLVVYEDPAFGAEPMLRASEVTADLRLTSLMRGRLEIARLDLTEPSLNLVHSEGGRWNLEALLERTARIPLAPTGKAKSEPRPGFPYIEGTSARINFKNGPEKKPYALTNADFSLWQDSENAWGVRLKAQPVRTDLNLNDTGLLQVSGTWQRAATLQDTPLQFSVEWSRAQLGQVTKFLAGNDKGWRGTIQLDVALTGSPAKLEIASTASVDDFRRYDITSGNALRLAGRCSGEYSSLTHEFHELKCSAPIAKGLIAVAGNGGFPGSHRFAIAVTAESVPASALAAVVQRAKKNLPDDLEAEGILHGKFSLREDAAAGLKFRCDGRGEISDFRLSSMANKVEIGRETVPFAMVSDSARTLGRRQVAGSKSGIRFPDGPHIEFGPIALDGAHGTTVRGWVNGGGYEVSIAGEAEIARALRVARMIGLPALPANPEGSAVVDLQIAGSWAEQVNGVAAGFAGPQVTGNAKLRNVKVALHGTGEPVEIVSADMQLSSDAVRVGKLNAKAAGAAWAGSLEMPRGCGTPENCPVHFAVNTDEVALEQLTEWAGPSPKKRAWYQVLEGSTPTGPSLLGRLRASGRIMANRLRAGSVEATRVSAIVILDHGTLAVPELNADLFGGTHRGMWHADFNSKPALCGGSGELTGISLEGLALAMKDGWIAGTANGNYQVNGPCPAEFWRSAEGTLRVDVRDGLLPHLLLNSDQEPFQVTRLTGQAELRAGKIEISDAKVDSPEGKYLLSGTATLQRDIAIKLTRVPAGTSNAGYSISGTLAEPRVTPLARAEQAQLKRPPAK